MAGESNPADKNCSSDEDTDKTEDNSGWGISLRHDLLTKTLRALEYYTANGLNQAFNILDVKKSGNVPKTQLQILCINLCTVASIPFSADDLNNYEDSKKELSFNEFLVYIGSKILTKMKDSVVDATKLDEISWAIVEKQRKSFEKKILNDNELFALWQAFNKINVDSNLTIDIEEAAIMLEEFMKATGTPWTQGQLDNFADGKIGLTFWELIECLEKRYIANAPKSVYEFGISRIKDVYNFEIIKTGMLTKKGHKVKSMKERFFVLVPNLMTYYEGKSAGGKQKGVILIGKKSKVGSVPDSKSAKCRFTVSCSNKDIGYQMEAADQKTKNEWIACLQKCIDCSEGVTPLVKELRLRAEERRKRRARIEEEEKRRFKQEQLISKQLQDLELLRQARDEAKALAENEAALKEEERKRREELEILKLEYERLLQEEKQARELENEVRNKQQQILEEEMVKRQELERIKSEQDRILEEERKAREGLEVLSKEQQKALAEERERLKELDEARRKAEEQVEAAHAKMEAAEEERRQAARRVEEAKEKTRRMKIPVGLSKPLTLEQKMLITHRGAGSFVDEDFSKTPLYLSTDPRPEAVNQSEIPSAEERAEIVQSNLVKPSKGRETFEGEQA